MKRAASSGQILPLTAIILFGLVFFIGANALRSLTGIQKIENQREADLFVLSLSNEQARALNGIAALNQGLEIAVQRGYAIGIALLTLEACAMAVFSAPICAPALARLGAKAVPFYRKLAKLGKALAKMQDQIAEWGSGRPVEMLFLFNHTPANLGNVQVFLFPEEARKLPIRREERRPSDEGDWADGNDLKKCERYRFETYFRFDRARQVGHIHLGQNDSLSVEYANQSTGFREQVDVDSGLALLRLRRTRGESFFQNATYLQCQSLQDLLSGFGLRDAIQIPPPYHLTDDFFQNGGRLTISRVMKTPSRQVGRQEDLDRLLCDDGQECINHPDIWSIAESEVDGADLTEMEFRPILRSITHDEELWQSLRQKMGRLFIQGFDQPPDWRDERAHLAH